MLFLKHDSPSIPIAPRIVNRHPKTPGKLVKTG